MILGWGSIGDDDWGEFHSGGQWGGLEFWGGSLGEMTISGEGGSD